jgi:hypothetical protein
MSSEDENQFDDPALKAAVRRTAAREAAPPQLRTRMQSLLAAEAAAADGDGLAADTSGASSPAPPASPASTSSRRRRLVIDRSFWRTAAVAAAVLLVVGWVGYRVREEFFPAHPFATSAGGNQLMAIPASLVLDLVRAHDACAKLADHHKVPGDDPEKLREKLTADAGVNASTVSLGGDWKFRGAGICQVGQRPAAHLQFVRGDEFVSIFSMAATDECGYGDEPYSDIVEKHPVAGFRRGQALYCVVASAATRALNRESIEPVLQKVQGSLAAGGCMTHETMMATAAASSESGNSRAH